MAETRTEETTGALAARLAVVGAALLFSTGGTAIKATVLSPWQVAGFRCAVAAFALALMVPRAWRAVSWRTALVGVAYAATMILYVASNKTTTAANAIFLQSTAPLYILLLSPRLLGERVHRSDLAWMGVIGLGLAAFFVGDQEPFATAPEPALGNVLGAASGLTWALTILGLRWLGASQVRKGGDLSGTPSRERGQAQRAPRRRPGKAHDRGIAGTMSQGAERSPGGWIGARMPARSRRGVPSARPGAAAAMVGNLLAFLACLPWLFPVGETGWVDWLAVGHLGVFQIALAYVLLTHGLERVTALEASLLLLIEPAASPVWAWLVHGEVPGPWAWAGGGLILLATTGKAVASERRRRAAVRRARAGTP